MMLLLLRLRVLLRLMLTVEIVIASILTTAISKMTAYACHVMLSIE